MSTQFQRYVFFCFLLCFPVSAQAQSFYEHCPNLQTVVIIAHQDDDIIFMNPDLSDSIARGECTTVVYITAGDAGNEESYWGKREEGAKAAHANMAGISNADWVDTQINVNNHTLNASYLASKPGHWLVFMRLPDGMQGETTLVGPGSLRYENVSLQKLWDREISTISAVDQSNSYTREDLIATLSQLVETRDPQSVLTHDYLWAPGRYYSDFEHSDHLHTAWFAREAVESLSVAPGLIGYRGYNVMDEAANVRDAELLKKWATLCAYAAYDPGVHWGGEGEAANYSCGGVAISKFYEDLSLRQYRAIEKSIRLMDSDDQSFEIVGVGSENCLDVKGPSTANGTPVQMWDCVGVKNQEWRFTSDGEIRGYGDKCLDVRGPSKEDKTIVQIYDCVGVENQKWTETSCGRLMGYGGKCLDVRDSSTDNQAIVQMMECEGGPGEPVPNQQWYKRRIPTGSYDKTCINCNRIDGILTCECEDRGGDWKTTNINMNTCPDPIIEIENCDGVLTCGKCQ